jgi:hypothetical protein
MVFLAQAMAGPGTPPGEADDIDIIEIRHRRDAHCDSRDEQRHRLDGERAKKG